MDKYSPADVRAARIAAGMTQAACSKRFGMSLRVWQRKEADGATGTKLAPGEYELLLLLGNQHPQYSLVEKK